MITHLASDILECEVKWALESITVNKASGGDGIPVELFQILKDPGSSVSKESVCNAGDLGSNPGFEDPLGKGMATHSSILAWRIPMDRGAWRAIVQRVTKSWT